MARWKPGLHKEVSAIFEGVSIPSAVSPTQRDRKAGNFHKPSDTPALNCSYFSRLQSQGLCRRPQLVRKVPRSE